MHRLPTLALVALSFVALNSCETVEYGGSGGRDYVPTVSLPDDLKDSERRLIGAVADVLEDAGYQTTRGSGDYELEFEVDDGPVNADVYITLLHDGATVVKSYARTGGPAIIFKRDAAIRESFDKCLSDFERRLPAPRGGGGGYGRSSRDGSSYREDPRYRDNDYLRRSDRNEEYDRDPRYYQ